MCFPAPLRGKAMKKLMPIIKGILGLFCAVTLVVATGSFAVSSGNSPQDEKQEAQFQLMDRFDTHIHNQTSQALDGVLSIPKVYWLSDADPIAPEPDQSKYGSTADPSTLQWLMDAAAPLLEGQETVFHPGITIHPGSRVTYYLDDSIFAVTWKQTIDGGVYTFAEVKLGHPSQFRRYLAGGEYGSHIQLKTTEMAATVNAVVASSGDFYGYRRHGVIVYDGQVRRVNAGYVDTCYVDQNGDLLVSYAGELGSMEAAQAFVEEHGIRFSLAFGPVLVENGEPVEIPYSYLLGQNEDPYPRAALCQKGKLHYIVAVVNSEPGYTRTANLWQFASNIYALDVETAYTLDGGQTAVIAMNDKLISNVMKGHQRHISDIFYFATAIPD